MNGILLDPITGRPESKLKSFHIDPHSGKTDRDIRQILEERGIPHVADMIELARKSDIKNYTRNKSYIGGRCAATAATARAVATAIWNPHATSRIFLYEIWIFPTTAASINLGVARLTARGTASSSVTAAIDHSIERDSAAPSGFILDLTYSAGPTVSASNNAVAITPAVIGNGIIVGFSDPITIPPGTGLALITTQAAAFPISDVTFSIGD